MSKTGYKRVYEKHGSYWLVQSDGSKRTWTRLCAVSDGEPAMLRALARHRNAPAQRPGSVPALISDWTKERLPAYAESTRIDYGYMLPKIEAAMRDLDAADVTSHDVMDLRAQWADKPRTANKYQALLSILMVFAIEKRLRTTNPCRDVIKLKEPRRRRLMTHAEQLQIREAAVAGRRHGVTGTAWRNANGDMYAALFDFAYLTAVRAKDARLLRWSDVGETEILIEPSKTRDSSGARIAIAITEQIQATLDRVKALGKVKSLYIFHTLRGTPLSASAVRSAWRRARERAGVKGVRFRDLRPKALSDAKRLGLSLEALRDAAGHTSVATTEGYIRGYDVKDANLGLSLPKPKKAV
jgi:integrase